MIKRLLRINPATSGPLAATLLLGALVMFLEVLL
jgi:hypothetical protein